MQLSRSRLTRLAATSLLAGSLALSGCAGAPGIAGVQQNAALVQGPPIRDIQTPFDEALACLKGKVSKSLVFAVGAIDDQTGKESFTDGGTGKFVTQGAGDIVQSALFKAGATVVNRRDPRITTTEIGWKIKDPRRLLSTNFYVTGSINSLDFIPGSGAEVTVAGVGPRYRQNRILVGLDLALTEANSSRVVANVPLQKQIFSNESGIGVGRFFGDVLLSGEIGGREREALNFALRQMLNLATFDLLTQVMNAKAYEPCRAMIDDAFGSVEKTGTAEKLAKLEGKEAAEAAVPQRSSAATMGSKLPLPPSPSEDTPKPVGSTLVRQASGDDDKKDDQESAGELKPAPTDGTDKAKAQAILTN